MEDFTMDNGNINFPSFESYIDKHIGEIRGKLWQKRHESKPPLPDAVVRCIQTTVHQCCQEDYHESYAKALYQKCNLVFEDYATKIIRPTIEANMKNLIHELGTQWEKYEVLRRWMSTLFVGLDTEYSRVKGKNTVNAQADKEFKKNIFNPFKKEAVNRLRNMYQEDAVRSSDDWKASQTCCDILLKFSTSEEDFELIQQIGT